LSPSAIDFAEGEEVTIVRSLPMSIKFDNRVSWMDIVAFTGVIISALYFVFAQGGAIEKVEIAQGYIQEDIDRIEAESDAKIDHFRRESDEKINTVKREVQDTRQEQKEGFDKLEKKLDKLIDRALNDR